MYRIFPELGEALDNLIANRHFWQDALAQELAANEAGVVRPPEQRAEEAVSAQLGASCGCCVLQVLMLLLLLLPLHGPPSSHRRGGTTHLLNGTACWYCWHRCCRPRRTSACAISRTSTKTSPASARSRWVVLQGGKALGGCFVAGRPLLAEGRSAAAEAAAGADLTWPGPPETHRGIN